MSFAIARENRGSASRDPAAGHAAATDSKEAKIPIATNFVISIVACMHRRHAAIELPMVIFMLFGPYANLLPLFAPNVLEALVTLDASLIQRQTVLYMALFFSGTVAQISLYMAIMDVVPIFKGDHAFVRNFGYTSAERGGGLQFFDRCRFGKDGADTDTYRSVDARDSQLEEDSQEMQGSAEPTSVHAELAPEVVSRQATNKRRLMSTVRTLKMARQVTRDEAAEEDATREPALTVLMSEGNDWVESDIFGNLLRWRRGLFVIQCVLGLVFVPGIFVAVVAGFDPRVGPVHAALGVASCVNLYILFGVLVPVYMMTLMVGSGLARQQVRDLIKGIDTCAQQLEDDIKTRGADVARKNFLGDNWEYNVRAPVLHLATVTIPTLSRWGPSMGAMIVSFITMNATLLLMAMENGNRRPTDKPPLVPDVILEPLLHGCNLVLFLFPFFATLVPARVSNMCDHALEKLNVLRAICPECSKEVHVRVAAVEVYMSKLNRGQGLGFAIQLTGFEPWVVDKRALRAAFAKGYTTLLAIVAVYTTVNKFSAGTFQASAVPRSYEGAALHCSIAGLEMASIHSEYEDDHVLHMIRKAHSENLDHTSSVFFIGSIQRHSSGRWVWGDGTPWTYTRAGCTLNPHKNQTNSVMVDAVTGKWSVYRPREQDEDETYSSPDNANKHGVVCRVLEFTFANADLHATGLFVIDARARSYSASKSYCESRGYALASLHNIEERRHLLEDMTRAQFHNRTFFVGGSIGRNGKCHWDDGAECDAGAVDNTTAGATKLMMSVNVQDDGECEGHWGVSSEDTKRGVICRVRGNRVRDL